MVVKKMIPFKERMKIRFDKRQTKFNKESIIEKEKVIEYLNQYYLCPFCLYRDKIGNFLDSNRINLTVCPECENTMLKDTLTREMTVEQFAVWVYNYSFNGFWEKCSYEIFNKRLKQMNLSRRFWDKYKQLKGDEE